MIFVGNDCYGSSYAKYWAHDQRLSAQLSWSLRTVARARGAIGAPRAAIRKSLDAVRQSFPGLIEFYVQKADPGFNWRSTGFVYQYTRFETLRGMLGGAIVETPARTPPLSSLWATSSVHMNDSEEFVRGKQAIGTALTGLSTDRVSKTMAHALQVCDGMEVYCACFSAVDDDLSQWRGYGENGAGVCLEFDLSDLVGRINGVGYWVIYGKPGDETLQAAVAADLVTYIYSSIHSLLPIPTPNAVYAEVREQLTEIWPALALAFKHRAFEAEQEFRIVYSDAVGSPTSSYFRPNPLIPFVKLGMRGNAQLPLRSIRLGPAISSELNLKSVRLALDKLGLRNIVVQQSDIPYIPR